MWFIQYVTYVPFGKITYMENQKNIGQFGKSSNQMVDFQYPCLPKGSWIRWKNWTTWIETHVKTADFGWNCEKFRTLRTEPVQQKRFRQWMVGSNILKTRHGQQRFPEQAFFLQILWVYFLSFKFRCCDTMLHANVNCLCGSRQKQPRFTHEGSITVSGSFDEKKRQVMVDIMDTGTSWLSSTPQIVSKCHMPTWIIFLRHLVVGIGISPKNIERIFHPFDQEERFGHWKQDMAPCSNTVGCMNPGLESKYILYLVHSLDHIEHAISSIFVVGMSCFLFMPADRKPRTRNAYFWWLGWGGVGWGKMLPSCERQRIFDATLLRSSLDFHTSLMLRYWDLL